LSRRPLGWPQRGYRPPPGSYRVFALNRQVLWDWIETARTAKRSLQRCFAHITETPLQRLPNGRCGPLHGTFAARGWWQYEITAAGRVWYVIDQSQREVTVLRVTLTHPRETD
jgi:hypothetical protein